MKNKEQLIERCILTPSGLHVREKEEGGESRIIAGYAILFGTPSAPLWSYEDEEAREVIAPEAVTQEFLDTQDIKMTMFHDRQLILARSNMGQGTLSYSVDEKGVYFEFEAPYTVDGDKALELVKRGDIAGCSFAFTTPYYNEACVSREVEVKDGVAYITYTVRAITNIYDFTLAADPAYPDTSVEAREFVRELKEREKPQSEPKNEKTDEEMRAQWRALREAASVPIV